VTVAPWSKTGHLFIGENEMAGAILVLVCGIVMISAGVVSEMVTGRRDAK